LNDIETTLMEFSGAIDHNSAHLALILAAGHGKRIKSEKSKMLHTIWGRTSIERVARAVSIGLKTDNLVFVLGIKALEVLAAIPKNKNYLFVYQQDQLGTGHAVRIAFQNPQVATFPGTIYVFPGDIGLLSAQTVSNFAQSFDHCDDDMMVLTANYEGNSIDNYYGRIVRVPPSDASRTPIESENSGKVVAIKEFKDIAAGDDHRLFSFNYHGRSIDFNKRELLDINEFNTSIYAYRPHLLREYIYQIRSENVQKENYLTDLIEIYNEKKRQVGAFTIHDPNQVLGFNNKSVLKQMENIHQSKVYEQLKDIVTIESSEHFFIADEVVEQILAMDREGKPLDIYIGMNVSIGPEVKLSRNITIQKNSIFEGSIDIQSNVTIGENCIFSNYPHQMIRIGEGTCLVGSCRIKGQVTIGSACRIESSVRLTGNDEFPVCLGDNVIIKGTSYIFGSIVESGVLIEHSVIRQKHVEAIQRKDGKIQPVRYILPLPEGMDSLRER